MIIGHGDNRDHGAMNWNNETEFQYNQRIAKLIKRDWDSDKDLQLFWRSGKGIEGVAKDVGLYSPDLSIELHNNAFDGVTAGCESLALYGDILSIAMGTAFSTAFCAKYGRRLRNDGCKQLKSGDRGFKNLSLIPNGRIRILVEPFFGDNPQDWMPHGEYAYFLADWLKQL